MLFAQEETKKFQITRNGYIEIYDIATPIFFSLVTGASVVF